uniref:Glycine zipper domain-containing protein n=1 Tax=Strigamia maritima TaxID=126957 RepID=T1J299_STRMM
MPLDTRAVMELVCTLSVDYNIRVTVTESLKGGLYAGTGAVVGGILGGPIGIAVGASVGGCVAAYNAQGKFKSAVSVILEMDYHKQARLATLVTNVVRNLDISDAVALTTIVMGDPSIQKQVIATVVTFLRDEMRMNVID